MRPALSVNECVCVLSFLPVSASVSFSASPGLERERGLLSLTYWTDERDARASEYDIPVIPASRSQGSRGLDDASRDLRSEQLRFW